jgi:hypothetical protein
MDEITKSALLSAAEAFPNKAVRFTHQFHNGVDGSPCGIVPNTWDGTIVEIPGWWWKPGYGTAYGVVPNIGGGSSVEISGLS